MGGLSFFAETTPAAGSRATAEYDEGSATVIPELDLRPQDNLIVSSQDTANWVLSYPAVLPLVPPPSATWAREANEAVGRGALAETVLLLESVPADQQNADWRIYRSNLLLRIGLVDDADTALRETLAQSPDHPQALALASVVASIRGDKSEASRLAKRATDIDPTSSVTWLALSYTQQAQGELDGALSSVQQAQLADSRNGTNWVREAELRLALGQLAAARVAADRALALQPDSPIAHSTQALVALLRQDWKTAHDGFERATRLNPVDANARFGLSLAHIHNGELEKARDELHIAVERAPRNGLFHAYLGRVLLALGKDEQSRKELDLAKKLDPNNPAAWLFSGQAALQANRPVAALSEIQEASTRNAGRRVYRGGKLLDEDLALNHIDQSRAYDALGFRELAMEQAQDAFEEGCCAAVQRNLADVYALFPRGIQARRSLALQSLFDAHPGQMPLELDVVQGVGSSANTVPGHALPGGQEARPAGLNEYSDLFAPTGWQMAMDGNVGEFNTWGEQIRVGGRSDDLGIGLAQLHQVSDGPDGKALDNQNWQLLLARRIDSDLSAFLEYRHATSTREEITFPNDPLLMDPINLMERVRVARIGANIHVGQNGNLKLLYALQWRDQDADYLNSGGATQAPGRADMPEIQYRYAWNRSSLTLGTSYFHDTGDYIFTGITAFPIDVTAKLLYGYGNWRPREDLAFTLGLSRVDFRQTYSGVTEYSRNMPKFGIHWTPSAGTSLRLTALEAAALPKTGGAGLEPVEIAGLQQWFGDEIGTVVRRLALNWNQALTPSLSLVMETGHDRLSTPLSFGGPTSLDHRYERRSLAGLYWRLPMERLKSWEGGLRLTYDRLEQESPSFDLDNNNVRRQLARHWTLGAQLAGPLGLGIQATMTRVDAKQRVEPLTVPMFTDQENFWIADLAMSKTFARGRGQLSLGMRNATDRSLGLYQEADPLLPRFSPQRFTYARLQWRFD